jgi:integrase
VHNKLIEALGSRAQGLVFDAGQELLGHATIAMTLDTYSHFLPSMGEQTVRAMEAALS